MRPILLSLTLFALCIACNNEPDKPQEKYKPVTDADSNAKKNSFTDSTFDCRDVGSLLVDSTEADKMMKLFRKHYKRVLTDLVDSVWIDSCVISGFAKYFEDNGNFDGARFYSGANSANNNSTIMLVPTTPGAKTTPKDMHKDVLTANVPVSSPSCNREFKNFNLTSNAFDVMKKKFAKNFRKEDSGNVIDSLSISVWISNCVFKVLSDLFRTYPQVFDGATIYFAAYDEKKPASRKGQQYQYQSTIIIVPTKPNGRNHAADWKILTTSALYQKYMKNAFDGINHGELCPDVCNTD